MISFIFYNVLTLMFNFDIRPAFNAIGRLFFSNNKLILSGLMLTLLRLIFPVNIDI
jgi:hypothetical protein